MIIIYFMYQSVKDLKWYEDSKIFYDVKKALRFLYATQRKFIITGWECENPEDNDYLNYRWHK